MDSVDRRFGACFFDDIYSCSWGGPSILGQFLSLSPGVWPFLSN